jgi:hypothetical protein
MRAVSVYNGFCVHRIAENGLLALQIIVFYWSRDRKRLLHHRRHWARGVCDLQSSRSLSVAICPSP